jgi:hypothetical protein
MVTIPSSIPGSEIVLYGDQSTMVLGDLNTPTNGRIILAPDTSNGGSSSEIFINGNNAIAQIRAGGAPYLMLSELSTGATVRVEPDGVTTLSYNDGTYVGQVGFATFTANRTYTFPNASGTVLLNTTAQFLPLAGGTMDDLASVTWQNTGAGASVTIDGLNITQTNGADQLQSTATGWEYTNGVNQLDISVPPVLTGNRTVTFPDASGTVVVQPWNSQLDITAPADSVLNVTNSGAGLAATFVAGSDGEAVVIEGSGLTSNQHILRIASGGAATGIQINAIPISLQAMGSIIQHGGSASLLYLTAYGDTTLGEFTTDAVDIKGTISSGLGDLLINDDLDVWTQVNAATTHTFASYNSAAQSTSTDIALDRYFGTRAAPTTIANGTFYGGLRFRGYNGTSIQTAAYIYAQAAGGTVSGTSMPGTLFFQTTPDGSNTPTTAMQIDPSQRVNIRAGQSSGTNARVGGTLWAQGTEASNGGTLNSLVYPAGFSYTLPANTMATNGDTLVFIIDWRTVDNGTNTNQFVIQYPSGTTVYDSGVIDLNADNYTSIVKITRSSATTATVYVSTMTDNATLTNRHQAQVVTATHSSANVIRVGVRGGAANQTFAVSGSGVYQPAP